MKTTYSDFTHARNEVSASSAGGAPFLICYGTTFILTGILACFLPRETSALIAMFQGTVALPAAFWLERHLGSMRLPAENPLREFSAQLAISQALAIPFLIVLYNINPGQIPVALAGLGGVHLLPYAWLHRTRIYIILSVIISVGAFLLILALGGDAYVYILLLVGLAYWVAAPLVYRHAKRIVAETTA
ncbi:MAG: hypothetical protein JXB38_01220 [Anaerolineales bacterium]|nr:hypothetical protein [Anaerolineales bacterium]